MKKKIAVVIIVSLLLSITSFYIIDKPDITYATQEELQEIHGIGPILSEKIVRFVSLNDDCEIEELIKIDGIGEVRLKLIRRKYD